MMPNRPREQMCCEIRQNLGSEIGQKNASLDKKKMRNWAKNFFWKRVRNWAKKKYKFESQPYYLFLASSESTKFCQEIESPFFPIRLGFPHNFERKPDHPGPRCLRRKKMGLRFSLTCHFQKHFCKYLGPGWSVFQTNFCTKTVGSRQLFFFYIVSQCRNLNPLPKSHW